MTENTAAGWYPDPMGRHEQRYWDGAQWGDQVSNGGVQASDPVAGDPASQTVAQAPGPDEAATVAVPPSAEPPPGAAPPPGAGAPPPSYPSGPPAASSGGSGMSTGVIIAAVVGVLLVAGVGIFLLTSSGDDGDSEGDSVALDRDQDSGDQDSGDQDSGPDVTASGDGSYPQVVIDNYLDGCTGAGAPVSECQCQIDAIQDAITLDEFIALEEELTNTGVVPDELTDAVLTCL